MVLRYMVVGLATLLASGATSTVAAQTLDQRCASTSTRMELRDACQKAVDVFNYLSPQLGTSLTGGNPTLGQGSTLGGFPHIVIAIRAIGVAGSLPRVEDITVNTNNAQQSVIGIESQLIGVPAADVAVGIFRGIPLGVTAVGGIDLLGSAIYIPEISRGDINLLLPGGSFRFGFGARVGLLEESIVTPGIAFTYLRKDLPTADIFGTSSNDTIAVRGFSARSSAWRVVASKSLPVIGVAVGGGQDRYESSASLSVFVQEPGACALGCRGAPLSFAQSVTRTSYFADLSVSLGIFKVVGEIGRVSGGSIPTFNSFPGKRADAARTYGSLGLRRAF